MSSRRNNNNERFNRPPVTDFLNGNFGQNFIQNFNQNSRPNFNQNPRQNFNGNPRQNFNGNPRQNFNGNPRQNFNGNPRQNFNGNPRQNFPVNNFSRPLYMNGNNAYSQSSSNLLHLLQTPGNNNRPQSFDTRNVIASYLPQYKNSAIGNKKAKLTKADSNNIISQTETQPSTATLNQSHSSPKSTTNESVNELSDKDDIIVKADSNLSQIPNASTTAESFTHSSSNNIKATPSVSSLNSESAIAEERNGPSITPSQNPSSSNASTSEIPTTELQSTTTSTIIPSTNLTNNLESSYPEKIFHDAFKSSNIASTSTSSIRTEKIDNSSCPSKECNIVPNTFKPPLSGSSNNNATTSLVDVINVGNPSSFVKNDDPNKVSIVLSMLPDKSPNSVLPLKSILKKSALDPSPNISKSTAPSMSNETLVSEGNVKEIFTKNSSETCKSSFTKDNDSNRVPIGWPVLSDKSSNSVPSSKELVTKSELYPPTNTSTSKALSISENDSVSEENVMEKFSKTSTETSKSSFENNNNPNKESIDLSVLPDKSLNSLLSSKIIDTESALDPSNNTSTSDNTLVSKGNDMATFSKNSTEVSKSSFEKNDDLNTVSIVLSLLPDKSQNSVPPSKTIATKPILNPSTYKSAVKALSTSDNISVSEGKNMEKLTQTLTETSKSSLVKNADPNKVSIVLSVPSDKSPNSVLPIKNILKKSAVHPSTNTSTSTAPSKSDNTLVSEGNIMATLTKNSTETSKSSFEKNNDPNNVSIDSSVLPDKSSISELTSETIVTKSALYPTPNTSTITALSTSDKTSVSEGNVIAPLTKNSTETSKSCFAKNNNPKKESIDSSVLPDKSSNSVISSKNIVTKSALDRSTNTPTNKALSITDNTLVSEDNDTATFTKNSSETSKLSSVKNDVPNKVSIVMSVPPDKSPSSVLPLETILKKSALDPNINTSTSTEPSTSENTLVSEGNVKETITMNSTETSKSSFTKDNVYSILFEDEENTLEKVNEDKDNSSKLSLDFLSPTTLKQSTNCIQPDSNETLSSQRTQANDQNIESQITSVSALNSNHSQNLLNNSDSNKLLQVSMSTINSNTYNSVTSLLNNKDQISMSINPAKQTEKSKNLTVIQSSISVSSECPDSSESKSVSLNSSITEDFLSPAATLVSDNSISNSFSNDKESLLYSVGKNSSSSFGSNESPIKSAGTSLITNKTEGIAGIVISKALGQLKAKSILRSKLLQDKILNQKNMTAESIDFKKRILKSKNLLNKMNQKNMIGKTENSAFVDNENPNQDSGEYYGCTPPGHNTLEIITPFQKEKKKNVKSKEDNNSILAMISKITDPSKSISKESIVSPKESEESKKSDKKTQSHSKKKSSSRVRSRSKSPSKKTNSSSKSSHSRKKSKSRSRSNSRNGSNSRSKSSSRKSSSRRSRKKSRSRSRSSSRKDSKSPSRKSRRLDKKSSHSPNKNYASSSRKRHRSRGTDSDDNRNEWRSQKRKQDGSNTRETTTKKVCGVQILTKDPVKHDILEMQILRIDSLFMHGNNADIEDKIKEDEDTSALVTEKKNDSRIDVFDSENEVDPWEVMGYAWKTIESSSDDEKETKTKDSNKVNGFEEPLKPKYDKNGSLTNRDAIIRSTEKKKSNCDTERKRKSSEKSEESSRDTERRESNSDIERKRKSSEKSEDSISDTERRKINSDTERKERSSDKNDECISDTERRKSKYDNERRKNSSDRGENYESREYPIRSKSTESSSSSSSENTIDISSDSEEDNTQKEKSIKKKKNKCKRKISITSDSNSETRKCNDKSTRKKRKAKKKRKRKSKKSEKDKRSKKKKVSRSANKSKTSLSYSSTDDETIVKNKSQAQDIDCTEVSGKQLNEFNDRTLLQQDSKEDYDEKYKGENLGQIFETEPSTSCDLSVNEAMQIYLEKVNNNKEKTVLKINSDIHLTPPEITGSTSSKDNLGTTSSELQKEEEQIQESVDEIFNQWQSKKKHIELEQEVIELRKQLKLYEERVQGKFAMENAIQQNPSYDEGSRARIYQRLHVDSSREDQMNPDSNHRKLDEEKNINIKTRPEENKFTQKSLKVEALVAEVEKDILDEESTLNENAIKLADKRNQNYEYYENNTELQHSLSISTDKSYQENIVHEYEVETRSLGDEYEIRNGSTVKESERSVLGEQLDLMLRDARLTCTENEVDPWEVMGYAWKTVESDDEKETKTKGSNKINGYEEPLKPKYDRNGSLTNRDEILRSTEKRKSNCDTERKSMSSEKSEDSSRDTRKSNSDTERKGRSSEKNDECISDTERRKSKYDTERRKNSSDGSEDDESREYPVRRKSTESNRITCTEQYDSTNADSGVYGHTTEIPKRMDPRMTEYSKCRISNIYNDSSSPASPDANEINKNNDNENMLHNGIRGSTTGDKAINPVAEKRNILTKSVDPRLYNKSLYENQKENNFANEKPVDPRLYNKSLYINQREDVIANENHVDRTRNCSTEQKAVNIEKETLKYDRNSQQIFCNEIVNELEKVSVIGSQTELKNSFENQPVKVKANRPYENIPGIKYKKKHKEIPEMKSRKLEHDKEDKMKNISINEKESISKMKELDDKTSELNAKHLKTNTNTSDEIENKNKRCLLSTTQDSNVESTVARKNEFANTHLIALQTNSRAEKVSMNKNPNLDSDYLLNRVTETTSSLNTPRRDESSININEKNMENLLQSEQKSENLLPCSSENAFKVERFNTERDSPNLSLLIDDLPLKSPQNLNYVENSHNEVKNISKGNKYNTDILNSFEKSQNNDKTTSEEKSCNFNTNSRYLCTLKSVPLQTPKKSNYVHKSQNKDKAISEEKRNDSNTNPNNLVTSVEPLSIQTPEKSNSVYKSQNKDKAKSEEKRNDSNTNPNNLVTSVEPLSIQTPEKSNSVYKSQNKGKAISEEKRNDSNTNPNDLVTSVEPLPLQTPEKSNSVNKSQNKGKAISEEKRRDSNINPNTLVTSVEPLPLQTTENHNSIKKSKKKRNFTKSLQMRNLHREKEHKENPKHVANNGHIDEEKNIIMQNITLGNNEKVTTVNLDMDLSCNSEYRIENDISNTYTTENQTSIEDEALLLVDDNSNASSESTEKCLIDHRKIPGNSKESLVALRNDKNSKNSTERTTILLKKSYRRIGVVELYHLTNFCPNCMSELIPDINTRVKLSTATLLLKCQVCYQEIMMIGVVAPFAISKTVELSVKIPKHSNSLNNLSNKGIENSSLNSTRNNKNVTQLDKTSEYGQNELVPIELKSKSEKGLKVMKSNKRSSNKKYKNVNIVENPTITLVGKREKPNKPKIRKIKTKELSKKSRRNMDENFFLHNENQNQDVKNIKSISNKKIRFTNSEFMPAKTRLRVIVKAVNDENVNKIVEIMGQKTQLKAKSKKLTASKIKRRNNGDKKTIMKKKHLRGALGLPKTKDFKNERNIDTMEGEKSKSKTKEVGSVQNKHDDQINEGQVESNKIHEKSFKINADKQNIEDNKFGEIKKENDSVLGYTTAEKTVTKETIFENDQFVASQTKSEIHEIDVNNCPNSDFECHNNADTNSSTDQCATENNESVIKTNNLVADLLLQIPENLKPDEKINMMIKEKEVVNSKQKIQFQEMEKLECQGTKDTVSKPSEDIGITKDVCERIKQCTELKAQTIKINEKKSDNQISNRAINSKKEIVAGPSSTLQNLSTGKEVKNITTKLNFKSFYTVCKHCKVGFIEAKKFEEHMTKCTYSKNTSKINNKSNISPYIKAGVFVCKICKSGIIGKTAYENHLKTHG